jgi:hypothetical protein
MRDAWRIGCTEAGAGDLRSPPPHRPRRVAQPAEMRLAHAQQRSGLLAARLPLAMQPNRIDHRGHPDLRQHAIPPVKTGQVACYETRTYLVLPTREPRERPPTLSSPVFSSTVIERDLEPSTAGAPAFTSAMIRSRWGRRAHVFRLSCAPLERTRVSERRGTVRVRIQRSASDLATALLQSSLTGHLPYCDLNARYKPHPARPWPQIVGM